MLYDLQTRQQIINTIKRTIAPDKQSGALVFFNKDTKGLESYVPSEGKFYDTVRLRNWFLTGEAVAYVDPSVWRIEDKLG